MSSPFHAGPGTGAERISDEQLRLVIQNQEAGNPSTLSDFTIAVCREVLASRAELRASSDREAALRAAWDAYTDGKSVFDGHTRICDMRTKASSFDCTCGFGAVVKAIINPAALASSGEERTDE